ncbi:hypothetical protein DYB28_005059 [Aphanomyces astaci]|uniref:Uncharacterized protein n=1 Tax=Aphanomyces astaci TaxID=112090 RepID=A0A9X8DXQ1_APHAT|nr:hypothetical protein DYB28_005059 [Aphanomyces astaci]
MAATLKDVDGFTRPGIDGKKAQNRFLSSFAITSPTTMRRLSGATEDETPKSRLQARSTVISQRSPPAHKRDSCRHTSFHHHVFTVRRLCSRRTKGVSTECGCAHALQQHELQVTAHRERIAADRRQAHFEWEQRQIHEAAA